MFARLSIYENVDLDLADRVKEFMETLESDPFADLPGYRGSMTLVDRDNARLVGIGFYASAGEAQEAGDAALDDDGREPRRAGPRDRSSRRSTCSPTASASTRSSTAPEAGHVPLVLAYPGVPMPSRRRDARPRARVATVIVAVARLLRRLAAATARPAAEPEIRRPHPHVAGGRTRRSR